VLWILTISVMFRSVGCIDIGLTMVFKATRLV
jgi:hypothetical protein